MIFIDQYLQETNWAKLGLIVSLSRERLREALCHGMSGVYTRRKKRNLITQIFRGDYSFHSAMSLLESNNQKN